MYSTKRPRQKPDYYLEMIDGELLLYHPGKSQILYCSQTASLIWQLCDSRRTVQEIITLLSDAFPEATDTIAADVEATLREFLRQGAIEFG